MAFDRRIQDMRKILFVCFARLRFGVALAPSTLPHNLETGRKSACLESRRSRPFQEAGGKMALSLVPYASGANKIQGLGQKFHDPSAAYSVHGG